VDEEITDECLIRLLRSRERGETLVAAGVIVMHQGEDRGAERVGQHLDM
jgi:hypothetical protein